MGRRISEETKQKRGMGTGSGADYTAYITTSEFNSLGTASNIRDWKTGRTVNCLSQAEAMWYYILRWNDANIDIREQFPLKNKETVSIAETLGVRHPRNNAYIMTTDFVVTEWNGRLHAYAVKTSKDSITDREWEKLAIEKIYWQANKANFTLLYKEDVNAILYNNIRLAVEFYNPEYVFDKYSLTKHMIATKKWNCDMSHELMTTSFLDKVWEANN